MIGALRQFLHRHPRLRALVRTAVVRLLPGLRGLRPVASVSDPASYRRWLARYDRQPAPPRAPLPRVTLILLGTGAGVPPQTHPPSQVLHALRLGGLGPAIEAATGEVIVLAQEGGTLAPHALAALAESLADADLAYADDDQIDRSGRRHAPRLKPDFDPDLLLGMNYMGPLVAWRRPTLVRLLPVAGTAGLYELVLQATRLRPPCRIAHVPAVLFHTTEPPTPGGIAPVAAHLAALGVRARVVPAPLAPHANRVILPRPSPAPLVSVIVPTRNRAGLLETCAAGVLERTDYPEIDLILVDNDSTEPEALALLRRLAADPRVRVLRAPGAFNFPRLNNAAAAIANGELLLLLNNDVEVIKPSWLDEMVVHAVRPDVGAVGAKLLYPDGRVQHGGVVLGAGGGPHAPGVGAHYLTFANGDDPGYLDSLALVRSVGAVTAACMMVRAKAYQDVGGMDETNLAVAFNDIDLCLRISAQGLRIVWTPFAQLYHRESVSRGSDLSGPRLARFRAEVDYMLARWGEQLRSDPYYNVNLSLMDAACNLGFPPRRLCPAPKCNRA
jgi:O-antigen biosynthesis protein